MTDVQNAKSGNGDSLNDNYAEGHAGNDYAEECRRVEAVLFTVGKEITPERIASLCSLPLTGVQKILETLQEKHAGSEHAMKLERREQGWKLTVRDRYVPLVSSIAEATELESSMMQTLAVIAWKYPVLQAEVIKLRGSSAYEHMKQLEESGFIAKEKSGRTFKLKLTPKFFEYFDLPSAEAKAAFLKQVPQEVLQEAEQVEKEANEVEKLLETEKQEKATREEIKRAMEQVKS